MRCPRPPRRLVLGTVACAVVGSLVALPPVAAAQPSGARPAGDTREPPAARRDVRVESLPVSLDRIREALERAPEARVTLPGRPTFNVKIEGRTPRFEDFLGSEQLGRGPSQPAPLVHQEFLALVTPEETRPFASFSSGELAVVSAQALATGLAFNALPSWIKDGLRRRREEQARREVAEVLAQIDARRRDDPRPEGPDPP